MDPIAWERIQERAFFQHGVVHRDQVLAEGISRHALAHLVSSGRWRRVLPSVYATSLGELSEWGWASAVAQCVGSRGTVARGSAAAAYGLLPWPDQVHVVVVGRHRLDHPRVVLHRTRELLPQDRGMVRGVLVTSPLRTLLDLSRELDAVSLGDLLALMLRKRKLSEQALLRRLRETPSDPYTAELRSMLGIEGQAFSDVEVVLARALTEAGFLVRMNTPAAGTRRLPDIIIDAHRVVVQLDSTRFHSGVRGPADVARDADWLAKGYLTIRVDPRRVRSELPTVVAEIVTAIGGR